MKEGHIFFRCAIIVLVALFPFASHAATDNLSAHIGKTSLIAELRNDGQTVALIDSTTDEVVDTLRLSDEDEAKEASIRYRNVFGKHALVIVARFEFEDDDDETAVIVLQVKNNFLKDIDQKELDGVSAEPAKTLFAKKKVILRDEHKKILRRYRLTTSLQLQEVQHKKVKCGSRWFDTHAHSEGFEDLYTYSDLMDDGEARCSLMFMEANPDKPKKSLANVAELVYAHPGRYFPFLSIDEDGVEELTRERLEKVLNKDTRGVFRGLGEYAFYQDDYANTALTHEHFHQVFQLAAERDLVVMIHLRSTAQEEELRTMLAAYPETEVLLHGSELVSVLPDILTDYTNLYFTLDTANLLRFTINGEPKNLMFPSGDGSAEQFIEEYDAYADDALAQSIDDWNAVIAAAPSRVMWGTDVAYDWHYTEEVYSRLTAFTKLFLEQVPDEFEAGYLYENAQALLGKGVALK